MISLLARLFIKNHDQYALPEVRRAYGSLCAVVAIVLNILLSGAKFAIAHLSGSFSIQADAWNNLTDAGSGLLLLLVFYFAGMKPRPDRPFGHGRIEYIGGLLVAGFIVVLGVELGRSSITQILHPAQLVFSWTTAGVLAGSIAVKCYMSYYMVAVGKKIDSAPLRATGLDSLSDTVSTFAALLALLVFHFSSGSLNLDGWFGLLVSLLILKAGCSAAWETLVRLLGTTPDPEIVKQVYDLCMKYPEVVGVHDLVVHDYGPGRLHISAHCEVPGNGDIYQLHDAMDRIMRELDTTIGCESVIHMDPVCMDDSHVGEMRGQLETAVRGIDDTLKIHDFRIVEGPTHTNVIFDCVVPLNVEKDAAKMEERLKELVHGLWPNSFAVVKIDRPYV